MDSNAEAEKITWVKADNFKNIAGGAAREAFAAVAGPVSGLMSRLSRRASRRGLTTETGE